MNFVTEKDLKKFSKFLSKNSNLFIEYLSLYNDLNKLKNTGIDLELYPSLNHYFDNSTELFKMISEIYKEMKIKENKNNE